MLYYIILYYIILYYIVLCYIITYKRVIDYTGTDICFTLNLTNIVREYCLLFPSGIYYFDVSVNTKTYIYVYIYLALTIGYRSYLLSTKRNIYIY